MRNKIIMSKVLYLSITFNYFISTDGKENALPGLEEDLAFQLGYDEAEIPISDKLLSDIQDEISEVLPIKVKLNRVGGELSLNDTKIKNF